MAKVLVLHAFVFASVFAINCGKLKGFAGMWKHNQHTYFESQPICWHKRKKGIPGNFLRCCAIF